ncbi:hypothetical protein [Cupriavidus basilensis]|uniref:hypothetical protein n=1 Tax=Cupriavidus basilensis TaxID=68895 RepID=UPI00157A7E86|nr:hypothetical protein [Cupriavidus basilensis]NUA30544.1 hypothetical protein [Cupriavidus basilensis]
MAQDNAYEYVIVESYRPENLNGRHGSIHIRPVLGEKYSQDMHVECSKGRSRDYPVWTRCRLMAKLTDREGGGEYLYSYHGWKYEVMK